MTPQEEQKLFLAVSKQGCGRSVWQAAVCAPASLDVHQCLNHVQWHTWGSPRTNSLGQHRDQIQHTGRNASFLRSSTDVVEFNRTRSEEQTQLSFLATAPCLIVGFSLNIYGN